MYVLGLSFDYHDAAAALLNDGIVIAAAQEERFSRTKNDPSLPVSAISFCLTQAGIAAADLEQVVFYEKSLLKLDRILRSSAQRFPRSRHYLFSALKSWIHRDKLYTRSRIARQLRIHPSKVSSILHHDSHAASTFFCSPFRRATVVTLDGVGEYETGTTSYAEGNKIQRLAAMNLPHSLGLVYSAFTAFLGFRVNEDEYKVMGMAAYGKPVFYDRIMDLFQLHADGTFSVDQAYFNLSCPTTVPYTDAMSRVFGIPPREPESPFETDFCDADNGVDSIRQDRRYADIAASLQRGTEEVILHVVARAVEQTGVRDVCMAGGVALNSLANGRIKRELGCRLYVHPAAGDAGGAIGAALSYYNHHANQPCHVPLLDPFLGQSYTDADFERAIRESFTKRFEVIRDEAALVDRVACLLKQGAVIGWLNGRFEWGPRALGARSILADPTNPKMKDIVNLKIKFREPFRPFAPAVLDDRASEFFDIGEIHSLADPEYFMLAIGHVLPEKRHLLPAVTHVDGTARVQLVSQTTNSRFYRLISRFAEHSGVPVLLNTSFNLRGEPIVNTPMEAIRTFEWSDMDYLTFGDFLIKKEL